MPDRIKKTLLAQGGERVHKRAGVTDTDVIRFSFKYLHSNELFGCHAVTAEHREQYWPAFMDRLREVSLMKMSEFQNKMSKALRNHVIRWADTGQPDGFAHLPSQLQECQAWQFCVDRARYGRVHGLILDEVFYIVWIDPQHKVYPAEH